MSTGLAQSTSAMLAQQQPQSSLSRYFDPKAGLSADEAVAYALAHNGELAAFRSEIEAARNLIKQASLRSNPQFDIERKEQLNGADADAVLPSAVSLQRFKTISRQGGKIRQGDGSFSRRPLRTVSECPL